MPDPVITNLDTGSPPWSNVKNRDELLTLAGADTIAAGTILARDSVSLNLVLFVKGGVVNENGIPKAIMTYEDSIAGAGDLPIRAAVSGVFVKERLIIDADGDGTNIDNAVLDQLRDFAMISENVTELNQLDNQ
jgi:hypothetical protein